MKQKNVLFFSLFAICIFLLSTSIIFAEKKCWFFSSEKADWIIAPAPTVCGNNLGKVVGQSFKFSENKPPIPPKKPVCEESCQAAMKDAILANQRGLDYWEMHAKINPTLLCNSFTDSHFAPVCEKLGLKSLLSADGAVMHFISSPDTICSSKKIPDVISGLCAKYLQKQTSPESSNEGTLPSSKTDNSLGILKKDPFVCNTNPNLPQCKEQGLLGETKSGLVQEPGPTVPVRDGGELPELVITPRKGYDTPSKKLYGQKKSKAQLKKIALAPSPEILKPTILTSVFCPKKE